MAYDDPVPDYEDPNVDDLRSEKERHGCFSFVSILLVVTLVGVSLPSLFWFFSLRDATPQPVTVTVEVSATPQPPTVPVVEAMDEEAAAVATPVPEGDAASVNRIAFINNEGQLTTINPDGTDGQILTEGFQQFQYPAWSPDSTQIAVIGQSRSGGAVHVVDAMGERTEPDYLYRDDDNNPIYLYWSPDGEKVGFIVNDSLSGIAMHVVPADGSTESRVVAKGSPFYWHWSANGDQMLIHSGGTGLSGGRVEMLEVGNGDGLGSLGNPGFFQAPGISADGRYLAFAERLGNDSQITIVDTEVSSNKWVEDHRGVVAMSWSPNSPLLAYISGNSPESDSFIGSLRLVNAETDEVTLLSEDDVVGFFWSPNGRYIAALGFVDLNLERDINVAQPKSPLAKPAAQFSLPQLELVIFDVTTMEGREMMRFTPTLTFLSQFLPFFDQYALSHQIWSPASDALVLPMLGENFNNIVVVSVASGEELLIAEGNMPFWSSR